VWRDQRGASAIEYLLLVGVAVVALLAFRGFGASARQKAEAQGRCVATLSCSEGDDGDAPSRAERVDAARGKSSDAPGDDDGEQDQDEPAPPPKRRSVLGRGWDFVKGFFVDGVAGAADDVWEGFANRYVGGSPVRARRWLADLDERLASVWTELAGRSS
jgi:Flp pilus assembly pilin Flp